MKTCLVEGCGRKQKARGMCVNHYTNWWRSTPKGNASMLETWRRYRAANEAKVLKGKRESMARWRAAHPEKARERRRKSMAKVRANETHEAKVRRRRVENLRANKETATLADAYVRQVLGFPKNAPTDLLEAKRIQLKLHRLVRTLK